MSALVIKEQRWSNELNYRFFMPQFAIWIGHAAAGDPFG
jgi:hypothetical protein